MRVDLGPVTLRVLRTDHPTAQGPPLLLCNGIGANLELWDPLLAHLDRSTITFDAPGVGGSTTSLYPLRIRSIADLVRRMIDRLDVPVVDVLGLSWGGPLAQELAHRHPARVRRLVLAATLPGWTSIPAHPAVLRRLMTPRRYRDPDHLMEVAADIYGGEVRGDPDFLRRHGHQRFLHQASARGYAYQLMAARRWSSIAWLHRLTQPTLVLSGDDDPIIPLVNARLLAWRVPDARLEVVVGGGHLFLLTRAATYGPMITDFLTIPPSRPSTERSHP